MMGLCCSVHMMDRSAGMGWGADDSLLRRGGDGVGRTARIAEVTAAADRLQVCMVLIS